MWKLDDMVWEFWSLALIETVYFYPHGELWLAVVWYNLAIWLQSLRPALLNVREMCYRISDMGLCKVEKGHTYMLAEFREAQFAQLKEVGPVAVEAFVCMITVQLCKFVFCIVMLLCMITVIVAHHITL